MSELLENGNNIFVFARGGVYLDKKLSYEGASITYGYRLQGVKINWKQFTNWILINNIELIIFNEQSDMDCVYRCSSYGYMVTLFYNYIIYRYLGK